MNIAFLQTTLAKFGLMAIGLTFILIMTLFLVDLAPINAQEQCELVRIFGGKEPNVNEIRIEPQTLSVSKGACVIWINWAWTKGQGERVVSIKFHEGEKCEVNTESPTLYKLDDQKCYVSSFIAYGGTSSLRFKEPGTFEYMVESKGITATKGKIIVK